MTRSTRQLTVRLDAELARAVAEAARGEGASLNRAAIALMRKGAGLGTERPSGIGDALDAVLGRWSAAEAAEFDRAVAPLERIDSELWETEKPSRRSRRRR